MNIFEERGITSSDKLFTAFAYYESVRLFTRVCLPSSD